MIASVLLWSSTSSYIVVWNYVISSEKAFRRGVESSIPHNKQTCLGGVTASHTYGIGGIPYSRETLWDSLHDCTIARLHNPRGKRVKNTTIQTPETASKREQRTQTEPRFTETQNPLQQVRVGPFSCGWQILFPAKADEWSLPPCRFLHTFHHFVWYNTLPYELHVSPRYKRSAQEHPQKELQYRLTIIKHHASTNNNNIHNEKIIARNY